MKRFILVALSVAGCEDRHSVQFSDSSSPPLQVTVTSQQVTVFEGAVVRTTMKLTTNGDLDDTVDAADLELRSNDASRVRVLRGVDEFTQVIIGAAPGSSTLDAYFQGRRVASIPVTVAAQQ